MNRYEKPFRVLMVGNSYSPYTLASTLQTELSARAGKPFEVITTSGTAQVLSDYGDRIQQFLTPAPDIVIVQEQSQRPCFAEVETLEEIAFYNGIRDIYKAVKECPGEDGKPNRWARIILYQTWARHSRCWSNDVPASERVNEMGGENRDEMFRRLVKWYDKAAKEAIKDLEKPLEIARVGEAWENYIQENNDPDGLYLDDGSHPSAKGMELTANVLANTILDGMPCCRENNIRYCVRQVQSPLRPMPQMAPAG